MNEKLLKSSLVEVAWQDTSSRKPDPAEKHYHRNSVEINIVISGWIKVTIEKKVYKIKRGEFYIIYPQTIIESIESGKNTHIIVVRTPSLENDKILIG